MAVMIPVELVGRPVRFAGQPHQAIAVRDVRARKKAEADLRHLAQHDALTGLPNRRSFNGRLDREIAAAASAGGRLALICLDLDRFKEVNDLFGHAAGDTLLQSVARCTDAVLDDNQMLARLGGDEFAVIVPGLNDPADCRTHRRKNHRCVPRRKRERGQWRPGVDQHRHRDLSRMTRSTAKA